MTTKTKTNRPAAAPALTDDELTSVSGGFAVTKHVDQASPKLLTACCKGTHIPEVALHVY